MWIINKAKNLQKLTTWDNTHVHKQGHNIENAAITEMYHLQRSSSKNKYLYINAIFKSYPSTSLLEHLVTFLQSHLSEPLTELRETVASVGSPSQLQLE